MMDSGYLPAFGAACACPRPQTSDERNLQQLLPPLPSHGPAHPLLRGSWLLPRTSAHLTPALHPPPPVCSD